MLLAVAIAIFLTLDLAAATIGRGPTRRPTRRRRG